MLRTGRMLLTAAALLGGAVACTDDDGTAPPVPDELRIVSGEPQSGDPGTDLPDPLIVEVVDAAGNGVANVELTWDVPVGGGELATTSNVTDADGQASNTYELGPTVGNEQVRVRALGLDLGEVIFDFTVNDGGGGNDPL